MPLVNFNLNLNNALNFADDILGPHDLFKVNGTINDRKVVILFDFSSSHNFIDSDLV